MYKSFVKIILFLLSLIPVLMKSDVGRNPFVPVLNFKKSERKRENKSNPFLAATVVQGEINGAIIGKREKRAVVFVGDRVWEYSVKKIDSDSIFLSNKNGEIIKLVKE